MKTIGLQVIDLESSFSLMVWPEISRILNERGYNVILFPGQTPFSPYEFERKSNDIYNYLNKRNIDLLILQTSTFQNFFPPDGLKELFTDLKSQFPVISFGIEVPELPSLIVDNYTGIKEVIHHLCEEHGKTKIGFVTGPPKSNEAFDRYRGYTDGMKECGLPFSDSWILPGDFLSRTGGLLMKRYFDLITGKLEALVFANDDMALDAFNYLDSRGVQIPEQLAIIGFDDMEDARVNKVPLTTIRQPYISMARAAAETAIDLLNKREVPLLKKFSTSFVIRSSCGCSSIHRKKAFFHEYSEGLEKSSQLKEFILNEISSQLSSEHVGILMDIIRDISKTVIEQQPDSDSINELLDTLDNYIKNVSYSFPRIVNWQSIISLIYTITKKFSPYHILYSHNDFFQRARILVGDSIARDEGFFRLRQYNELTIPIRLLNYQMNSVIDNEEINEILLDSMEQFHFENCYVSLYMVGEKRDGIIREIPARSQLVFAYRGGVQLHVPREKKYFSSESLLPPTVQLDSTPRTYMLGSLFFKAETLGLLFMEVCRKSPQINENIRLYLSSAFHNSLLYQERDLAELKLRSLLSDIEDHKSHIKRLSLLDNSTGVLQKKGFIVQCSRKIDEIQFHGGKLVFVFIRVLGLDEFRQNNPLSQSDSERRHVASHLKGIFREEDILSLMDEDTFIACLKNPAEETEGIISARIDKLQNEKYRQKHPHGFTLSLCFVRPSKKDLEKPLEQYLDQAEVQYLSLE